MMLYFKLLTQLSKLNRNNILTPCGRNSSQKMHCSICGYVVTTLYSKSQSLFYFHNYDQKLVRCTWTDHPPVPTQSLFYLLMYLFLYLGVKTSKHIKPIQLT